MSKTQNNYRNKVVDMVRATGEYISANADNLVDMAELKTGFTMIVTFDQETTPEISIEQSHFMRNVVEFLYD